MTNTYEEKIKKFLTQMAKQDNRATASPYYYVIRDVHYVCVGRDSEDYGENFYGEDYDKVSLMNSDYEVVTKSEYKKLDRNNRNRIFQKKTWIEKGMFLTETDAIKHLEQNYYHYSKEAHNYIHHCWRANEMSEFINALFQHFNIEKGNQK